MHKRYIALKRISLPDGKHTEVGGEIPNAHLWRNPGVWVASKYMREAHFGELPDVVPEPVAVEVETVVADEVGAPADAMTTLADMLAEVLDTPDAYKKADMVAAAEAAGVAVPDPMPRRKDALVTALAEAAGITL